MLSVKVSKIPVVTSGARRNMLSRRQVKCVCDARKKYETKISNRVKENVNNLIVLGSADFKMMYELLKEADTFHREKMNELMKNVKMPVVVSEETKVADEDIENIFIEKQ